MEPFRTRTARRRTGTERLRTQTERRRTGMERLRTRTADAGSGRRGSGRGSQYLTKDF
jgi:hypothetical protein